MGGKEPFKTVCFLISAGLSAVLFQFIERHDFCAYALHILKVCALDGLAHGRGAVTQDDDVVVERKRVVAGRADAVGRGRACQNDGLHTEPAQNEVKARCEKCREAGLYDGVIALEPLKLVREGIRQALCAALRQGLAALRPNFCPRLFDVAAVGTVMPHGVDQRLPVSVEKAYRLGAGRNRRGRTGYTQRRRGVNKSALHIYHYKCRFAHLLLLSIILTAGHCMGGVMSRALREFSS